MLREPFDERTLAHDLFDALREVDARGAETVYARCPSPKAWASPFITA